MESLPIGTEKNRLSFLAKVRCNSSTAFLVPLISILSPYLPNPICSATCRHDKLFMVQSPKGKFVMLD